MIFRKAPFYLVILLFICGCKRFLEIDSPKNQLVDKVVFDNEGTANAAVLAIYSKILYADESQFSYRIPFYMGISCDELKPYSTEQDILDIYANAIQVDNSLVKRMWLGWYNLIFHCNSVLEGLDKSLIDNAIKRHLIGEVRFLRAFCYFYLVNLFGETPLILTTSYEDNRVARRVGVDTIYSYIIDDLSIAKNELPDYFVGTDGVSLSNERVRASKYSAMALLARVYIFVGDYEKSEKEADSVIKNDVLFKLDSNLSNISVMNNEEAILQLQPFANGRNTPEASLLLFEGGPIDADIFCSELSAQLLNAFENNDKRRENWVDSTEGNGKIYYYANKYKVGYQQQVSEYSTVLRLAEQYLLRAEARTQIGDLDGAKEDINQVRHRAGLPNTSANTKKDMIIAIMHERQLELFTEWGHRWMDLKRMAMIDSVMAPITLQKGRGTVWHDYNKLLPIPQQDRIRNPFLSQNAGYAQ